MDSGDDFTCAVMRAALLYAKMNFVLLGEHKNTVDACTADWAAVSCANHDGHSERHEL